MSWRARYPTDKGAQPGRVDARREPGSGGESCGVGGPGIHGYGA
jgi:hypothetical protein